MVGACIRLPEMRTCSEKESLWQNKTWVGDRGDSYLVYAVDPQRFLASSHVCQRRDLKTYQALRCQPSSHHHANSLLLTGGCRDVHTSAHLHSLSSRRKKLLTEEGARNWVASLSRPERNNLERALQEERPSEGVAEAPSWHQLRLLCYQCALPFIGFGFLDNFIMITVGEYIDWTIGVSLGISTMAAAGLGNLISDLAGLGLADRVEAVCLALGIPNPNLSPSQRTHRSSRWMALLGRCVGITIGCLIGMAPLLWFHNPHKHSDCAEEKQ